MKRILIAAALIAFGLSFAPPAYACSCEQTPPDRIAVDNYDAVFSGVAGASTGGWIFQGGSVRHRFEVERVFRGRVYATQWVHAGSGGGDCGFEFDDGVRYLVFASGRTPTKLSTSICSNTHRLAEDADVTLAAAGRLIPGRSHPSPPNVLMAALTIALGLYARATGRRATF